MESLRLSPPVRAEPEGGQIREIDVWLIPWALAIDRVERCVASAGLASEGRHDDRLDLVVADRAPGAGPGLVEQPVEAPPAEPPTPLAHRCLAHPRLAGDIGGSSCPPHMPRRPWPA